MGRCIPRFAKKRPYDGFRHTGRVEVAGRRWTVHCLSMVTAAERVGVGPWFVLVGALGFTALMAIYFAARVSDEDRLRKARDQLASANQNLAAKTTELEASLSELGNARSQLMHEEALKSVGRLAAGIAHEINTPVQFVSDSIFFARDATESLATLIQRYQEAHSSLAEGGSWKEVAAAMTKAEEEADLHYILEKLPRAIARSLDGIERVTSIVRSMKEFAHTRPEGDGRGRSQPQHREHPDHCPQRIQVRGGSEDGFWRIADGHLLCRGAEPGHPQHRRQRRPRH